MNATHLQNIPYASKQSLRQVQVWLLDRKNEVIVLSLIVIFGSILRLWGIKSGLPGLYDPDVKYYVDAALGILRNMDPNPHRFTQPATTVIYLLAMLYGGIYVAGHLKGIFPDQASFSLLYHHDPTLLFFSGRLLMAVAGTVTIPVVYAIARRLFGQKSVLLAALIVAVLPLQVHYAKIIRSDLFATLFMLVAFWFCIGIVQKGDWRSYIWAGAFTGLAVVSKYTAAVMVVTIILAHLLRGRQILRDVKAHMHLVASGFACIAATFIASPFLYIDFRSALADIASEGRPEHLSATGGGIFANLWFYLQQDLLASFTIFGVLFLGIGIGYYLLSKKNEYKLLVAFPLIFTLFISSLHLIWDRWLNPALPVFAILLAGSILLVYHWLRQHLPELAGVGIALAIIPILLPIRLDVIDSRELSDPDTRDLAGEWILANIPRGSKMLVEKYTPQLPKDWFQYFYSNASGELVRLNAETYPYERFLPSESLASLSDLSGIQTQGIEYIVLSDWADRYENEQDRYPEIAAKYRQILASNQLIYEIFTTPGYNKGPHIRVLKTAGDQ